MEKYNKVSEAYKEVLSSIAKYKDVVRYSYNELEHISKCHLFEIELQEKFGLDIKPNTVKSLDYLRISNYLAI